MRPILFLFCLTHSSIFYGQFQGYKEISEITYVYNTFKIGVPDTDFSANREIQLETKTNDNTPVFFRFFFKKVISDTEQGFIKIKDNNGSSFTISTLVELSEYDRFVEMFEEKDKIYIVMFKGLPEKGLPINITVTTTEN
ncbi:hypothetical protein [Flagellimonas iocasae]|uniref:Uncharacterized protein n=1 Tax=Flagellimonas iocasae TaxID=2055905 RepID=A0ABW4Y0N2_9FLAO